MADGRAGLEVRGLSFSYTRTGPPVLRGVDLTARPGEVLGLLGPNGSGKTTMMCAILSARRGIRTGVVTVAGQEQFDRSAIGFTTQQVALYPELTVQENLVHAARLHVPRRSVRRAVEAAIGDFGLSSVRRQTVHRLSGGWQRMAHIAASQVHRPPVRLLDEATVALDFEARARLVALVGRWAASGVTCVVTSHVPEDIEQMCSTVLLIAEGQVMRQMSTAGLVGSGRRLTVTAAKDGRTMDATVAAPTRLGDLSDAVTQLVADSGWNPDDELRDVRLSGATLRSLMAADPALRSVLDEQ